MDIPNGSENNKSADFGNEEKKDNSAEFGQVIDALHSKQKLSSLRTYQGDMAEYISKKNESVISIAVKQKEKEREDDLKMPVKSGESRFKTNLTIIVISLILLVSGGAGLFYIYNSLQKEPVSTSVPEVKIIPYNNLITLANITSENLGSEIAKIPPSNGVSILKISNASGILLQKSKDFFSFLKISLPPTLSRTLKDDYALGIISQNDQTSYFLIISVNDFGLAFSSMLEWEQNMENDLSFLNPEVSVAAIPPIFPASSTASTTLSVVSTTTQTKSGIFEWKDMIVKNKDTRALANLKDQAKIAYTFLDKNTILITNNLSAIGDLYSIYASRAIAR